MRLSALSLKLIAIAAMVVDHVAFTFVPYGTPLWTVMDWRQPAVRPRSIFRLWGGDIMYEKRFVAPVMRFLSHVLADDGAAWVAEPGRGVYEAFLQALHGGGLEGRRVFSERVEPLYAQPVPVTVAVWEIRRRVRPA